MADPLEANFARTWRLLAYASLRARAGALLALVILLGGWFLWLVLDKVSVYASSQTAYVEATRFPQPIQTSVSGTVVSCNISLAQRVREGEVLLELDARQFELQLAEAQANLDGDLSAITALEGEIDAQKNAREAIARLVSDSAQAGRAKVAVSQTTEQFQNKEAAVLRKLSEKDLASGLDELHAEQQSATNRALVAATSAQARQDTALHLATLFDRDVQIAALTKLLTDAQSKVPVLKANVDAIQYEVDRRRVRSGMAGTLVDIIPCTPGMTVNPDQRLATLLPQSELRVVSLFRPEDSIGRVKPGQAATLRVDNFPWTQFGTVGATVQNVGNEPRDGLIRVELVVSRQNPLIPIMHGLTGTVEIQVERLTPFQLLLRTIGQQLSPQPIARPSSSSPTSPASSTK